MDTLAAILRFDGGARPGNAASGSLLTTMDGRTITHMGQSLGNVTNNVAEHCGLRDGLLLARAHGVQDLRVYGDSDIVLGHVFRNFNIGTDHLKSLALESRELAKGFATIRAQHVDRELNAPADAICNAVAEGWWLAPGACRTDGSAELGFTISFDVERERIDNHTRRGEIKKVLTSLIERTFSLAHATDVRRTGTNPYVRSDRAIITYLVRLHVSAHVAGDSQRRTAVEERLLEEATKAIAARRTRVARICG